MNDWAILITYVAGVNIIGFILMGIDKRKAKKHAYRIPERTFWGIAIIGGALGSFVGMKFFHHKTKHWNFLIGMPILFILHLLLILYIWMS